ncbi:MAG TPA: sigma-54 dependent transcriptional regulator [Opitutaceae bacterium]|nr:sigma-54 dependent transcriptional regulator [Opitutaceae bacterium]
MRRVRHVGMIPSVLVVDDEKHTREGLHQALEENYDCAVASNADEAFNLMDEQPFDVIVTDLKMPGKSGLKVIDRALTLSHKPVVIMMTAYGNIDTAVEAMKRGAFDFLTKPVNLEKLELLIQRALRSRTLEVEVKQLHERLDEKFSFEGIIGNSPKLAAVIEQVRLVAPSKATVLIEGETGTGKEMIAQAIHQASPRARAPFLAVHCAALPATLLESELFGHEKGSFTGATERRVGRFESVDTGTLFLDEIGEISTSTQVKLLRFLETRTVERIGSQKPVPVDVRLVAATNRDLDAMVREKTFREDLFFRLNVVRIKMPPLRERSEDIPLLLDTFIRSFTKENGLPDVSVDAAAMRTLQAYAWPGNIRELRNFAENIVVMRRGGIVGQAELDPKFFAALPGPGGNGTAGAPPGGPPSLSVEENERRLLRQALIEARGNRTKAAKLMGISRRTLHRKIHQWPELDVKESG